jgi:hypothetical protein
LEGIEPGFDRDRLGEGAPSSAFAVSLYRLNTDLSVPYVVRSRDGSDLNPHPNTKRAYLLRGRVVCRCGRRMLGHHHRGHNYYRCWPKNNNRGRLDKFADHPQTVYMREDAILTAVNHVYAEYLFGHRRIDLLAPQLAQADDRERTELDQDDQRSPATATREDLNVLDLLPYLAVNLRRAPAELQVRLYELTKLRISIDH